MLNISMTYHFIYKIVHQNGKYYIGRHSTNNLDDGYIGSGRWPRSIKDKSKIRREIIEFVEDAGTLAEREGEYLKEHFGKPNCMNATPDPIGFDSANNPMKNPSVAAKISGDNHWTNKDPDYVKKLREPQLKLVELGKHPLQGNRNPNKDGKNAKIAMQRGTHVNITNNPSKWRSEQGIHHWQHGRSPNAGNKLNAKRIADGTHNLLGPEQNKKRIAEGNHNFLGSESNLKRLAEGRHPSQMKKTCEHCGTTTSVGMFKRWHGDRCKKRNQNG